MDTMKTIMVRGFECESLDDALGWVDAMGNTTAIKIGGKILVVPEAEARRLDTEGISFAYVGEHQIPDGTFRTVSVSIPVH